jgi:hypothetical protein
VGVYLLGVMLPVIFAVVVNGLAKRIEEKVNV